MKEQLRKELNLSSNQMGELERIRRIKKIYFIFQDNDIHLANPSKTDNRIQPHLLKSNWIIQ